MESGNAAPHNTQDILGRKPPQSIEAEQCLLGSMILNRNAVADVIPLIPKEKSDWFYRENHRTIFQLLLDIYNDNEPMDLVILKNRLERKNQLQDVGGVSYLVELAERVGSWVNVEHYANIVREKGLLRDVIQVCGEIMNEAFAEAQDSTQTILDMAEQKLFDVTQERTSGQLALLPDLLQSVTEMIDNGDGGLSGVPTGFHQLDELTSGFQRGDLIIVAARPSMGKTAFGLTVAEHMAVDEHQPCLFFSMEMSNRQVAQRLICSRSQIDSHKFRRNMLSEEDKNLMLRTCGELHNAPLLIDETPGMTVMEVRAKSRRAHLQHGIQAIFVDYLQLMHCPGKESRQQEIAEISRGLKALGRELNVPIVAMAQLNRAAEQREGNRPRMSDLRESGAIEQDADVILLLHREEYYQRGKPEGPSPEVKGVAEVIIAKQRNGPTDIVKLQFNGKSTRFNNLAPIADIPHMGAEFGEPAF